MKKPRWIEYHVKELEYSSSEKKLKRNQYNLFLILKYDPEYKEEIEIKLTPSAYNLEFEPVYKNNKLLDIQECDMISKKITEKYGLTFNKLKIKELLGTLAKLKFTKEKYYE